MFFFCQWSSNCNCYYYVSGWEVSGDLRVTCCIAFDWYSDPRYPDLIQSEAIVSGRKRIKVLCLHDFLYFSKRWITLLCILSGYMLQTNKAKIRHWNIVRTWGMILRFVYTSMMLNYFHCWHWNTYYLFKPRQKLTETMPWESFVFCH